MNTEACVVGCILNCYRKSVILSFKEYVPLVRGANMEGYGYGLYI